ncbi:hypothetical protein [Inquilinus sp. Marseille-Q2685]|uniref:hypothetical protein n=1 Tax=Inquilinus sp. Marseille-Q2685 TaxID=2866581 RepID=UPI001CE43AB5|nr:hypothetical protein [Inquilinus sp. Marseille-Q2685]
MGSLQTLAFLAGLGTADPSAAELAAPIDLSGVDTVVVTGGGLSVTATTDPGRPLLATLQRSEDCAATLRVEGRVLTVDVREQSSVWPRDCRPSLSLNLRPGADLSLRPAAVSATLSGRFGAVAVEVQAAELSLAGQARTLDLSARALQATLRANDPGQAIRIQADAADLDLGFRRGTPVSYQVDARMSVVDSTIPASAVDRPLVSIKGEFVRARIGYAD